VDLGVIFVDTEIRICRMFSYSILISLSFLLLAGCAWSQCVDCEDNDPCTRDWCNGTQCQHDPQICDQSGSSDRLGQETEGESHPIGSAPAYEIVVENSVISPRDAPSNPDSIDDGQDAVCGECNDGDACTDDICDQATGKCVPVNNAAPCDDGNACTTGDTCSDGSCKGAAASCDDGNACTKDSLRSSYWMHH